MSANSFGPEQLPLGVLEVDASLTNPVHYLSLLSLTQLNIFVDGRRFPGQWGRNAAQIAPGQYRIAVSFQSFLGFDLASTSLVVPIYAGYSTLLRYDPGMFGGLDASLVLRGHSPLGQSGR